MCSMAVVTTWRPRARGEAADGEVVRLRRTRGEDDAGGGGADEPRHLGARAVEGGARLEPERVRGPGVADAALEERAHQRDDTGVDGREARVVEVDAGDAGAHPTESFGRGSGKPRHPCRSPGARVPCGPPS